MSSPDLPVLAATVQRLVDTEEIQRLKNAYSAHYLGKHGKQLPDSAVFVADSGRWEY